MLCKIRPPRDTLCLHTAPATLSPPAPEGKQRLRHAVDQAENDLVFPRRGGLTIAVEALGIIIDDDENEAPRAPRRADLLTQHARGQNMLWLYMIIATYDELSCIPRSARETKKIESEGSLATEHCTPR